MEELWGTLGMLGVSVLPRSVSERAGQTMGQRAAGSEGRCSPTPWQSMELVFVAILWVQTLRR